MIRIFSVFIPSRVFTLFVSEIVLLYLCYLAASYVDPDLGDASLFFANLYADVRVDSRISLFQKLCVVFGVSFIAQGLIGYIDPALIVPRKIMLPGSVLGAAVL